MTKFNEAAKYARTKVIATTLALAVVGTSVLGIAAAPTTALANDGLNPRDSVTYKAVESHHEGDKVTIGDDWGTPVYAEWHRGASGKWWAMFYTYNYTKVYAEPTAAGCGWAFHAYDKDGNFVTIYRCEESSTHGLYGPQGVSSHWSNADASMWF